MRYDNEFGKRALGIYANHEHVVVSKELLTEIVNSCGYLRLAQDIQELAVNYDFADRV